MTATLVETSPEAKLFPTEASALMEPLGLPNGSILRAAQVIRRFRTPAAQHGWLSIVHLPCGRVAYIA